MVAYYPRSATREDLFATLGRFGTPKEARLAYDRNGAPLCFGHIEFVSHTSAEAVLVACRRGRVILDDEFGHTWHLRASWARHPIAPTPSSGKPRRRRARGGKGQVHTAISTPAAGHMQDSSCLYTPAAGIFGLDQATGTTSSVPCTLPSNRPVGSSVLTQFSQAERNVVARPR